VKVSGTATLNAPAEQVWAALNDPAVLVRTIPGCERLEAVGTDRYRMTVTAGVASIKGTYLGDVELADHVPYSAFTLKASGAGAPGTVNADVKVTLDEQDDGTTVLNYAADAVVGGTVGGVGQRVLGGVARKLAGEFFQAVNAQLDGVPAVVEPAAAPTAAPLLAPSHAPAPAPGPEQAAAATAFTRPQDAARSGRNVTVAVRNQLPGAVVGAAIALIGVLIGWRIARPPVPRR
jgi:carbon monoxide dehydrogenase subunit G